MNIRLRLVVLSLMVWLPTQVCTVPAFPFDLFPNSADSAGEMGQSSSRIDIGGALSLLFDDVKETLGYYLPFGNLTNLLTKSTIEMSKITAIFNMGPTDDDQVENESGDKVALDGPTDEYKDEQSDEPSDLNNSSVTTASPAESEAQQNENMDEKSKRSNDESKQLASEELSEVDENFTADGELKERIERNAESNAPGSTATDGSVLSKEELCKLYASNHDQSIDFGAYEDFDYVYDCDYDYDATPVTYYDDVDNADLSTEEPSPKATTDKDDYPDYQIYTDLDDFEEDYSTNDELEIINNASEDDGDVYQSYDEYADYYADYYDYDDYDEDEKNNFMRWISGESKSDKNTEVANKNNDTAALLNGSNKTPLTGYTAETNYPSNYTSWNEAFNATTHATTNPVDNEPYKEIRISTSY